MRYKIVITFPKLSTAKKMFEYIQKSKLYQSSEIVNLHKIKEVCDECLNRRIDTMRNNHCEKCRFALQERDSLFEKCTLGHDCDAFRCRECEITISPQQHLTRDGLCSICYNQEYNDEVCS